MEPEQTINSATGQAANVDPLVISQDSLKTLREMLGVQCSAAGDMK